MVARRRWLLVASCSLALIAVVAVAGPPADPALGQAETSITVDQHTPGNVVLANETLAIGVDRDGARVRWSIRRYGGERVCSGRLAPNQTVLRPDLPVGHYTLALWLAGERAADGGDDAATTETTLAVLPTRAARTEDPFYGMSTGISGGANEDAAQYALMNDAGVTSVRAGHDWHEVERERGTIDFSNARNPGFVADVDGAGFHHLSVVGYGNPVYGGEWNHAPDDERYRRAYARYARTVARTFPTIDAFEIWNEYNIETFATGPAGQDPAAYEELVERTAPAIREERPNGTIVVGATTTRDGMRMDWPFWRGYFDAGGGDHADVYSIHTYRDRPIRYGADVARLRSMSESRAGTTKPIWVTEFGWPTSLQGSRSVGAPRQARYAVQSHVRLQAANVRRAYWYTFRDQDRPAQDDQWDQHGLVRHPDHRAGGFTPKPSLSAYATMTAQLAGAVHVNTTRSPVPTHVYGRAPDRLGEGPEMTRVLWAPWAGERRTLSLATGDPLTVTTMTGERYELHPYEGAVTLTVGHDPVYVTGPVEDVRTGAPFSLADGGNGTLSLGVTNDGASALRTTHRVADRTATVTASPGATAATSLPVPRAYRTRRPTGADPSPLVSDVVTVDGRPVGLLVASVDVEPRPPATRNRTPAAGWRTTGGASAFGHGFAASTALFAVAVLVGAVLVVASRRRTPR